MILIDKWLDRRYKLGEYTCSDFTREVWLDLTGIDLGEALRGLLQAHDGRGLRREHVRRFRALREPVDPCIVVMQQPREPVHVAVYVNGQVLQITQRGVTYLPLHLATAFHKTVRFAVCTS